MISARERLSSDHLIAIGRTSEVYRWDRTTAAKVLNVDVPPEWADLEASFTDSVRRIGVAAPEVLEVTVVGARPVIVFGLVEGASLWQTICDRHGATDELVGVLVETQRAIHAAGVPDGVASLVERQLAKLDDSSELSAAERRDAHDLLESLPRGAALLHGDLHPGNVLLGQDGPVVIDWFDAAVGNPHADVARTALLLQASGATDLRHLPGADSAIVSAVERSYGEQSGWLDLPGETRRAWIRVMAASRLSERTDADTSGLLNLWRTA